jgi:hypothetical protein
MVSLIANDEMRRDIKLRVAGCCSAHYCRNRLTVIMLADHEVDLSFDAFPR